MRYAQRCAALLLLAGGAVTAAFGGPGIGQISDALRRSSAQNYRDAALAECIARAYRADPHAARDAQASASGFEEWTRYDAENSAGKVEALIDRYLARRYASVQGPSVRLDLMKCLDMYHGPELDALTRKYVIPGKAGR